MAHAGQTSRRERLERIEANKRTKLRGAVEAMIWEETKRQGAAPPSWLPFAIYGGGVLVLIAWLAAWALES